MRTVVAFVIAAWLAGGCSPSEAEIRAEFEAFVEAHNLCAATEECVLASTDCPLGCAAAVNVKDKAAVEQKARQLVDEYESFGRRGCAYDCQPVTAVCTAGRCQLMVTP